MATTSLLQLATNFKLNRDSCNLSNSLSTSLDFTNQSFFVDVSVIQFEFKSRNVLKIMNGPGKV